MADHPARQRLSDADRTARLDAALAEEISRGGRVESRTAHGAVVAYGYGSVLVHVTFAVLTLFTCGLFVFPWIVWANTSRERRVTLDVDPAGDIVRSRAR